MRRLRVEEKRPDRKPLQKSKERKEWLFQVGNSAGVNMSLDSRYILKIEPQNFWHLVIYSDKKKSNV